MEAIVWSIWVIVTGIWTHAGIRFLEYEFKKKDTITIQNIDFRANSGGIRHYGLCQYTECGTTQGETCKFPYRYKGRLYDTCITLDNLAEETGKKWCSTNTDEFDNHVIGSEQTCTDNCERDMVSVVFLSL